MISRLRMKPEFTLILLFLSGGCTQPPQPADTKSGDVKTLHQQIEEVKNKLDNLEKQTTRLRFELDAEKTKYDSIVIDPSSKGYLRLDSSTGSFLVSLRDVQPYADGYKLKLNIGNPTSATYSGFALDVKWNKSFEKFSSQDWDNAQHEKTFKFAEKLMPGSWNTVFLTLSPAQKEELEYIEISMTTDQVILFSR